MTTPAHFPVNPVLTGLAVAYKNKAFIADEVSHRVTVGARSFKYFKQGLDQIITHQDTRVGRKSIPNEVEFGATEEDSSVRDYGLDDVVPNEDVTNAANVPGMDPLAQATESLTDLVGLDRELRVANLTFDSANYDAGNKIVLAGNDQWSDYVNSDPVTAILDAQDAGVIDGNVMVLGRLGFSKLKRHPKMLAAIKGDTNGDGVATKEQIAEVFELDEVLVGAAFLNSAKPGQPAQRVRIWGNHASIILRDKLANLQNKRPTFSLTAQHGGKVAGNIDEPKVGLNGSVRVRSGESVREVLLGSDLGYLFQNII